MDRSYHLLDLIDKEKLEAFLVVFTDVTGVASIITEVDGCPITEPHNFRGLCKKYSRSTAEGIRKCYKSDSHGGRETARLRRCLIYKCLNAGLLDAAAPIMVEGYHLATILCGQVLEKPMKTEVAVQRARSIGITDIEGYLKEVRKIPIMSAKRLRTIVDLMEMITQTVSELAMQKIVLHKYSELYLNTLINSVGDCIISIRPDLAISRINKAGAAMFGSEEEKLLSQSILTLLSGEDSREAFQKHIYLGSKGKLCAELSAVKANKEIFPVQMSLSRISAKNKKDSGYVAVIRDITEEKQIEQMKEDLIGMMTHDMQNPVLSIQKAVELLVEERLGNLNWKQMEVMNLALVTCHQLFGMVTDFLDIYRNENGRFVLHKLSFDINQMLRDVIKQLDVLARDKKISVRSEMISKSVAIRGDRNRLIRTIMNIFDNSIKFSPEHSEIKVTSMLLSGGDGNKVREIITPLIFRRLRVMEKYVLVTISDQGVGIPKEHQKHIFDKFFTVSSGDRENRKGLGLGLSFCKLAVEAHGGFIWAQSPIYEHEMDNRRGCRFNIILPMGSAK